MRILSLQPTATEILFALGLGKHVVGVSHECTYPPEALKLPIVVRATIDSDTLSSGEIDAAVREAAASGNRLYALDHALAKKLKPDLIFTQDLCDV
jgi:iron complex transport system substrate-binding protein